MITGVGGPAYHVGRSQSSCLESGARTEGLRPKGRELGWGFWGAAASYGAWGNAVKKALPAGSGAELRPLKSFLAFYRREMVSRGTCWGQVREAMAPLSLL